ncbi:MAG: regulatory iron-sulfur-containing complex subunit RicT [Patescibacteria group bacterium]|nr:regulatory iron-sulfur-containing complex subunit RicT [Patescibacteria group bacterium]
MLSLYIPISNEILAIPHEDKRWKEEISPGDFVLFRDEEGNEEYAKALLRHEGEVEFMSDTLRILRKANDHDIQKIGYIEKKGLHATVICQKYADSLNLNMNVVRSDYSFDESMINFVFVSEDRVDFRELLKKLSGKFRKSIHLQQVGPRDKAKLVGGLGVCGRELCCHKFLSALPSVTMESARNQGIMHRGTDSLT